MGVDATLTGERREDRRNQGGPAEKVEDQRNFWEVVGKKVVQIMVEECRDAQMDSEEGLLALASY